MSFRDFTAIVALVGALALFLLLHGCAGPDRMLRPAPQHVACCTRPARPLPPQHIAEPGRPVRPSRSIR